MKYILLLLLAIFELNAAVVKSPIVTLESNENIATIKINKIDVGMSGFAVHEIAPGHTSILKKAVVRSYDKDSQIATLEMSDYIGLKNNALPSGKWKLKVGDMAVFAFGYSRALLIAPNEEIYKKLLVPLIRNGWERLMRTLELLPSLNTRKVIRHTLVKGWNMEGYEEAYAKLDLMAEPHFIEPKAYVFVGYSRERLNIENMPSHAEIQDYARKLSNLTGYKYEDERTDSRVVLLMKEGAQRFIEK